ncbi:MAG: biotin/lipoyl-containing protein [Acidobacteriota bacterium]
MTRTVMLRESQAEHKAIVRDDGTVSVGDGAPVAVRVGRDGEVRVGDPLPRVAWTVAAGEMRWVYLDGEVFEIEVQTDGRKRRAAATHGSLSAPMPASVVRVDAQVGTAVRRGDTLVILEAMKMELPVRAPADGTVTAVHCKPGDLVQPGVPLIEIV